FRSALPFTHPRFGRTRRHRLVRENADEDLAFTLEVARDGHAARLDLVVLDPAAFQRLQTEFTEIDLRSALGVPGAAAPHGLAVLHSSGHQGHSSAKIVGG